MKDALSPVAALLIGVAILLAGSGLQGTLLPVRASLEAFSTLSIGLIGGSYFLGFTIGCIKAPQLVGLVGHVRVFAAMAAMASAAPLAHGLVLNPIAWAGLRVISGFCFAALYIVIESWLNEQSSNENRGIVFSTYVVITLVMMAAGQMLLVLYSPTDMRLFAMASILVSLAAIPVALSTGPAPTMPATVRVNLKRLYTISPAGAFGCLVSGLANGTFWALAPVFAVGLTSNTDNAAWFMTAGVLGGALTQWPMGYLSDRLGRRRMMIVSAVAGILTSAVITLQLVEMTVPVLLTLGLFWGAAAFPLYSLAVAHANDYADPSDYVMVSSGLLLMYGVGAIVGPFLASTLMTTMGPTGMFLFTGIAHSLLVVFTIARSRARQPAALERHVPFGDALATTYTASHVYEEEIQQKATGKYRRERDNGTLEHVDPGGDKGAAGKQP